MKLVISAGEASGDYLAARLVSQLKARHPSLEVAGIAGPLMRAQGVNAWFDMNELNVMGLTEVLSDLPRLVSLRRQFRRRILDWSPNAFLGVDAPDFNFGLAKSLKKRGLRTLHYVSPSIWAWRRGRAKRISRAIDHLFTLFPFEPELYQPYGLEATFVGHPLADDIDHFLNRKQSPSPSSNKQILLLPGSRSGELRRHLPLVLETASRLRQAHAEINLHMTLAADSQKKQVMDAHQPKLGELGITVSVGDVREAILGADVTLAASGTVTLETFLMGCPQVVFYRLAPTTYWLAKSLHLVKSQWISLPNILTQTEWVPELIQNQATPEALCQATMTWLNQPQKVADYRRLADQLRQELLAGDRVAHAIINELSPS